MSEGIGRSETRIYTSSAFPDGYIDVSSGELEGIESVLIDVMTRAGLEQRTYDEEAIAFHKGNAELRQEPVMLRRWKANMEGTLGYDTLGLTVIIRGMGEVQAAVHYALNVLGNVEPDATSTEHYQTYSFGCKI